MRVSHESPLELLEASRSYNDYDYALVHLFETNKTYLDFFMKSKEMGREIILDNSIFELGKSFEMSRFAYWVNYLKPTFYIIPDVLDDADGTIANIEKWMKEYAPTINPSCKIMCVVQGKNYQDMVRCYKVAEKYADKIAISFNSDYFTTDWQADMVVDKLVAWMLGRMNLIYKLDREGVLNHSKMHHLLGVALPQEVQYYRHMPYITTVDTSNPIVHGMFGCKYQDWGLNFKRTTKLVDLLDHHVTEKEREIIDYNLKKFREFAKGM